MIKIAVNTRKLQKALGRVSTVVNPGSIMPIFSNVEFDFSADGVVLKGSDTETTISMHLSDVSVKNETETQTLLVNGKLLLDLLKSLPNEEIAILFTGQYANVGASTGSYQVPVMYDKLPNSPTINGSSFSMKGFALDMIVGATISSVSTDDMRPTFCGVCFDFQEEGTSFVSTNAFKLARYKSKLKGEVGQIVVPTNVLNNIRGLQDEEVFVSYNETNINFTFETTDGVVNVWGRLIDGKYPPYERIIPENNEKVVVVDQKTFLESLKRASLFATEKDRKVILDFFEGKMEIVADNINYNRHANEEVETKGVDFELKIAFNGDYLAEMLKVVGDGDIKLSLSEANKPMLLNNAKSPGLTGLVAPTSV